MDGNIRVKRGDPNREISPAYLNYMVITDELQSTGLSIMPEGLEEQIGRQDMADLVEYMMSVR